MTREISLLLLRGIRSAVESGTLGLELGALIVVVTKRSHATAQVLEVPKSL